MATLNNNVGDITLTKKSGTVLTLSTEGTYVDSDIQFTLGVQSGVSAAGTASADADVVSGSTSGGTNISSSIGEKTTTEPSSGYFIRIDATGTGRSQATTAGWIDAGALPVASTTETKYFPVSGGLYSASVSSHSISTTPVVTAEVSSSVTNITTTTQPSGTDGTDYWTITPSGSVTTTGISTAQGTATVGTAGYVTTGSTSSSEDTVSITPTVTNGTAQYIRKGTITNNTSGGTSSGTINRGKQIKIGKGYYSSDQYYKAQNNSGTRYIETTSYAGSALTCNGFENVIVNGIQVRTPLSGYTESFTVKVPNGSGYANFVFNVDSSGNVTITES